MEPKNSTRARYRERVALALRFIEDHLDQTLCLDDIAVASHFSPFHFHRIFQSIMNESVNDYVVRRRMETGARLLAYERHLRVTDIAEAVGYSSTANFSKAVNAYFGCSPSAIRNPSDSTKRKIGKLFSKYGKNFDPRELYPLIVPDGGQETPSQKEEYPMNVDVIERDEVAVSCLTSPQGYVPESIVATWKQLIAWGEAAGIPESEQQYFGLCHSNPAVTPVEKCRYVAALVIPERLQVNAPFNRTTIPGGRFARVHYKGPAKDTGQAHLTIFNNWLPESGFEPDDHPSMEHYLNVAEEGADVELEVLLKLKALE